MCCERCKRSGYIHHTSIIPSISLANPPRSVCWSYRLVCVLWHPASPSQHSGPETHPYCRTCQWLIPSDCWEFAVWSGKQAISLRPFCRTLGCSALSWTELPRTFLYGSGCAISFHPLGWISRSGTWGHMVNTCLTLQEPAISSPNCFYQPEGAKDMFL